MSLTQPQGNTYVRILLAFIFTLTCVIPSPGFANTPVADPLNSQSPTVNPQQVQTSAPAPVSQNVPSPISQSLPIHGPNVTFNYSQQVRNDRNNITFNYDGPNGRGYIQFQIPNQTNHLTFSYEGYEYDFTVVKGRGMANQVSINLTNNWTRGPGGNVTIPDPVQPPADTLAPTLVGSVTSSALTQTSATINWTTNEASSTQVFYWRTGTTPQSTALNSSMATAHQAVLSNLIAGTQYNYYVESRDAAGNILRSANSTFTTQAVPVITNPDPIIPNTSSGPVNVWEDQAHTFFILERYANGQVKKGDWYVNGVKKQTVWYYESAPGTSRANMDVLRVLYHIEGNIAEYTRPDAQGRIVIVKSYLKSVNRLRVYNTTPSAPVAEGIAYWWGSNAQNHSFNTTEAALAFILGNDIHIETSNPEPPVTDTTAPALVGNVTSSGISQTSASLTWTTNEASTTQLFYWRAGQAAQSSPLNGAMSTSHQVALSNLAHSTQYTYYIESRDAAGNVLRSANMSFTTLAPVITDPDPVDPVLPDPSNLTDIHGRAVPQFPWTTQTEKVDALGRRFTEYRNSAGRVVARVMHDEFIPAGSIERVSDATLGWNSIAQFTASDEMLNIAYNYNEFQSVTSTYDPALMNLGTRFNYSSQYSVANDPDLIVDFYLDQKNIARHNNPGQIQTTGLGGWFQIVNSNLDPVRQLHSGSSVDLKTFILIAKEMGHITDAQIRSFARVSATTSIDEALRIIDTAASTWDSSGKILTQPFNIAASPLFSTSQNLWNICSVDLLNTQAQEVLIEYHYRFATGRLEGALGAPKMDMAYFDNFAWTLGNYENGETLGDINMRIAAEIKRRINAEGVLMGLNIGGHGLRDQTAWDLSYRGDFEADVINAADFITLETPWRLGDTTKNANDRTVDYTNQFIRNMRTILSTDENGDGVYDRMIGLIAQAPFEGTSVLPKSIESIQETTINVAGVGTVQAYRVKTTSPHFVFPAAATHKDMISIKGAGAADGLYKAYPVPGGSPNEMYVYLGAGVDMPSLNGVVVRPTNATMVNKQEATRVMAALALIVRQPGHNIGVTATAGLITGEYVTAPGGGDPNHPDNWFTWPAQLGDPIAEYSIDSTVKRPGPNNTQVDVVNTISRQFENGRVIIYALDNRVEVIFNDGRRSG